MSDLSNNIVTYTTGNKAALEQQVNDFKTNAENLKTAYKDGVEGVTKDQVEEAEELQERAEIELAKYNDMYGTLAAIATGKADEINAQQQKIKNGFIDAETGSRESLENQLANFAANYELLKTAMDENQPGVTQKMVDNAKELVDKATVELNKLEGNGKTAGKNGTEGVSDGMKNEDALEKVDKSGKKVLSKAESSLSESYNKGYQKGKDFTQDLQEVSMRKRIGRPDNSQKQVLLLLQMHRIHTHHQKRRENLELTSARAIVLESPMKLPKRKKQ